MFDEFRIFTSFSKIVKNSVQKRRIDKEELHKRQIWKLTK